jgi:hypothetical protein
VALLLLFPHAVMIGCPETAARAAWLREQHETMIWSAGDIWTSGDGKVTGWKDRVYAADVMDAVGVVQTPRFDPTPVPFSDVHDLFEWFGYSAPFCLFVRAGWWLALGGAVLWLVGLCRGPGGFDLRCALGVLRTFAASLAAMGALALVPAGVCASLMGVARSAAERGHAEDSLAALRWAERAAPVVAWNGDVLDEVGLLQSGLGMTTPESRLHRAKALEFGGFFDQADEAFAGLLGDASASGAVRREAGRGLLRRGIRALNGGRPADALQALEVLLAADPCNVKASFVIQLAYLRAGRLSEVAGVAARLRGVYSYFGTLSKVPVLGASQENVASAAYLGGDAVAAQIEWKKLSDPKRVRDGR